ncbi:MAG: acyl-CoA dehydrogenase, partial [Pseudomonadota bacterium]
MTLATHDFDSTTVVLADLTKLTAATLPPCEALLERAKQALSDRVSTGARISGKALEADQYAAHGLAWLATYVESLKQMQAWANALHLRGQFGETEALLLQIAFGEYLAQISGGIPMSQSEILRPTDLGLTQADLTAFHTGAVETLIAMGNTDAVRQRLVGLMIEQKGASTFGATG